MKKGEYLFTGSDGLKKATSSQVEGLEAFTRFVAESQESVALGRIIQGDRFFFAYGLINFLTNLKRIRICFFLNWYKVISTSYLLSVKKSWPILYIKLLYKIGSGLLGHTVRYRYLVKIQCLLYYHDLVFYSIFELQTLTMLARGLGKFKLSSLGSLALFVVSFSLFPDPVRKVSDPDPWLWSKLRRWI